VPSVDAAALASRLAAASDAERAALLAGHGDLAGPALAWALKDLYFATNTSDPRLAAGAAAALVALASANAHYITSATVTVDGGAYFL